MQAQLAIRRSASFSNAAKRTRAVVLACILACGSLLCTTAVFAQDSGKIQISLTVPQQINASIYASQATERINAVCILSGDAVAFSVARLITGNGDWRLLPLQRAESKSNTGVCSAGVTLSIRAGHGNPVTFVISPE